MKKETAIKTITECAKDYHQFLENQNLLFVFGNMQKLSYFEAIFLPRHFRHLTGVEVSTEKVSGSVDFYEKCLKGHLTPNDFSFAKNGTTEMKLSILPHLMKIYRFAKMVGEYNFTKSLLYTEKLAGNVTACLGFIRDGEYYIPNTVLKEDIRDITKRPQQRMLAIYRKQIGQKTYCERCYLAKGIEINRLTLPSEILDKIMV